ncbi:four-carbon acid sugar kinase family protein [Blastococcus deserti]|uniref:Four-carbon acid sugar kinase family protein n=1 Tax=Blastococcus deserti TaxID=2259033 RepID=A0ABW4X5L9_9ACTN
MVRDGAPRVLVLADDLSGAAETAAVLMSRTTRSELVLAPAAEAWPADADVLVVDLDDRQLPSDQAAARAVAALRTRPAGPPSRQVLAKFDSLLRGPVAAHVGVLRARGGVVVAPALPALHRVVHDGVLTVDGAPLSATAAWATQGTTAPDSVAAVLAPLPTVLLDLSTVRSATLPDAVARAVRDGRVPVCDGDGEDDLDAVVSAVTALSDQLPLLALAGSAGLAAALGRTWSAAPAAPPPPHPGRPGPLVVVGTAEPVAARQVARLTESGVAEVRLPAATLLDGERADGWPDRLAAGVGVGPLVVRIDPDTPVAPSDSRKLAAELGELVGRTLARTGPLDLVLTGGETARRVLDALGVTRLTPVGQVHHGAVLSRLPDGSSVVTRPGSFGGPDSLLMILAALRPSAALPSRH